MADMFYSLQEACSNLGKTEEEVKALVASGQLEEIRDGEDLKFAAADIDVLAGSNDSVGDLDDALGGLGLDDTSGQSGFGLGLADTGTGLGLTDTSESTGVSMFDTAAPAGGTAGGTGASLEGWVDDDPEATQIGDAIGDDLSLEAVGSGSGLLDLTADSDDTALGAELLDEAFNDDNDADMPAGATGLFDAASSVAPVAAAAPMATPLASVEPEVQDGGGSGLAIGISVVVLLALGVVLWIAVASVTGITPGLVTSIAEAGGVVVAGGIAGGALVVGAIGFFFGRIALD